MGFSSYFRRTSAPASGVLEAVDLAESVQLVDDEPQAPIALAPVHGFEDRNTHPGGTVAGRAAISPAVIALFFVQIQKTTRTFPGPFGLTPAPFCSGLQKP
jgi:hypothetical protein